MLNGILSDRRMGPNCSTDSCRADCCAPDDLSKAIDLVLGLQTPFDTPREVRSAEVPRGGQPKQLLGRLRPKSPEHIPKILHHHFYNSQTANFADPDILPHH